MNPELADGESDVSLCVSQRHLRWCSGGVEVGESTEYGTSSGGIRRYVDKAYKMRTPRLIVYLYTRGATEQTDDNTQTYMKRNERIFHETKEQSHLIL